MDDDYDFDTDFLDYFEKQAKEDIAKYLEENKLEDRDEDEFYEEMEHLLFNFNSPEIYKQHHKYYGGSRHQLLYIRECYQFIDNNAEMLDDAITWVVDRYRDEIGDDYKYEGIVKLFAMVWYLVGRYRIQKLRKEKE